MPQPELKQRPLDLQSNALPNYAITAYKYNSDFGIILLEYSAPGRSEKKRFVCPPVGAEEVDLDIDPTELPLNLTYPLPRLNQNLISVEA